MHRSSSANIKFPNPLSWIKNKASPFIPDILAFGTHQNASSTALERNYDFLVLLYLRQRSEHRIYKQN